MVLFVIIFLQQLELFETLSLIHCNTSMLSEVLYQISCMIFLKVNELIVIVYDIIA